MPTRRRPRPARRVRAEPARGGDVIFRAARWPSRGWGRRFDLSVVQDIRLTLEPASIAALDAGGGGWGLAAFEHEGHTLEVGVHLKGTTTYRDFRGKPAFRVKFNEIVPGRSTPRSSASR